MVNLIAIHHFCSKEGTIKAGDQVRVDERRARELVENGCCRVLTKPAGPSANMRKEPDEKKSSVEELTGPSTGSQSSSQSGPGAPSPASPAAPASTRRRSRRSQGGGSLPLQ